MILIPIAIFLLVSWVRRRPRNLKVAAAAAEDDDDGQPIDVVVPEGISDLAVKQIKTRMPWFRTMHEVSGNNTKKLYKIDGLAERFVFVHPNTYIVKDIAKHQLFDGDKPVVVGGRWIPKPVAFGNPDLIGYSKIAKLIGGTFWIYTTGHTVVPLTKTILKESAKRWSKKEKEFAAPVPLALTTALQDGKAVLPRRATAVKSNVLVDHVYDKVKDFDVVRTSSSPNLKRLGAALEDKPDPGVAADG